MERSLIDHRAGQGGDTASVMTKAEAPEALHPAHLQVSLNADLVPTGAVMTDFRSLVFVHAAFLVSAS